MLKVPRLTNPEAKLIRTLEGVVWVASNVALVVAPIVTSHVSPADSVQWGSIMNTVVFASRQALKGLVIAKAAGLPASSLLGAAALAKVEADASTVAGQVAGDISKGTTVKEVSEQVLDDAAQIAEVPPPAPVIPAPPAA